MKNYILMICWFSSFLIVTGCQPKYIELTKKDFSELDASKVIEIDAVYENRFHTGDRWLKMGEIFPIKEPDKISIVINCIKEAGFDSNEKKILFVELFAASIGKRESSDHIKRKEIFREIYSFSDSNIINVINNYITENNSIPVAVIDDVMPFYRLYFKTNNAAYFIRFLWDKKSAYGDWWDSPELLRYFRQWGLKPL